MSERGRNRFDADRLATIDDELAFALRSLDDLEHEHDTGQLGDEQFNRLHNEYVVRAAEAARKQRHEAKLRVTATPHRLRFRAGVAAGLAVAAVGTVFALHHGSQPRADGATITGNQALSGTTTAASSAGQVGADTAAERSLLSGDLPGALKQYLTVLDSNPRDVEALTYAGWISYLGGVPKKALPLLTQAEAVDPKYPDAHAYRGIVLFKTHTSRTEAASELKTYLRLVPNGQMSGQVSAVLAQVQRSKK
jgi:tetratricopeptide (TPR) repeat protein